MKHSKKLENKQKDGGEKGRGEMVQETGRF